MIKELTDTEILIKETAKKVFFSKGHINASAKEIAEEAGVNRALVHYYFRSIDSLFNLVFEETMRGMTNRIVTIFGSDHDLRTKIITFLDAFIDEASEYPYLETFLVTEMAKNPEKIKELHPKNTDEIKALINKQLQKEIEEGKIPAIQIDHFMVNLLSMCNYPLIAKPVIQTLFGYEECEYKAFLKERKKVVYRVIFNEEYQGE